MCDSSKLQKISRVPFNNFYQGDPEIDASKVDSTMRVDEYDESTQAAIRKIMVCSRRCINFSSHVL